MSMVGEVWVSVYNPWNGLMIPGAEVVITSPCEPMIIGVTNSSGVFKTFMTPCPQVSFVVAKAGYREGYATLGVGGDLTEVDIALAPSSGTPPPLPPVVTDLGIHVSDKATGSAIAGAQVTLGGVTLVTNSYGICLFRELALAVYEFLIQASGYHDQSGTVDTSQITNLYVELVSVAEPPPPPLVEVSVKTRVRYMDGSAASGESVRLVNRGGGYDAVKTTGSTGYATFNQVPVGEYRIYLREWQWDITVFDGMGTVQLEIEKPVVPPPPTPPGEIPVEWIGVQVLKSGVYEWAMTFNVIPIPFVSGWLAKIQAGGKDDEAMLNTVMAQQGIQGIAEILEKKVDLHYILPATVDRFTITYKVKFTLAEGASLLAFAVLLPFIPALLSILYLIILGLIVTKVVNTVKDITERPPSPNLLIIAGGAVATAYLLTRK